MVVILYRLAMRREFCTIVLHYLYFSYAGVDDLRDVFKEILTLRSRYHMLGLVLGLPVREM